MARRRPILVAVRLTPDESADWRAKAKAGGVPLSALIRRAMARTRTWTVPAAEVERDRTRQVSRIGNNLNQIASGQVALDLQLLVSDALRSFVERIPAE